MFIDEIPSGQQIKLSVRIGSETKEFEVVVKESLPKKHAILTDVILINEKPLSFKVNGIAIDVNLAMPDAPPMVFRNVRVILSKDKSGSLFYAIMTPSPALSQNRRMSYRLFMGKDIVIQCGSNHSTTEGILKDISATGFSVVLVGDEKAFTLNQVIHTVLNDRIDEVCQNFSFQLYGIVVRIEEMENNKTVYGCKLNNKVAGIENYIMLKDRINIMNKNKGASGNGTAR